jgi:hypothetical protein
VSVQPHQNEEEKNCDQRVGEKIEIVVLVGIISIGSKDREANDRNDGGR